MTVDHAADATRLRVDQPWRDEAACIGLADVMDPPAEHVAAARDLGIERHLWEEAKGICRSCPVLVQCRSWAVTLPARQDVTGVCGGLTEAERQTERRRRAHLTPEPEPGLEPGPAREPDGDHLLCTGCGQVKLDGDFGVDRRMPGRRGRRSHCRVCTAKYWRAYSAQRRRR